MPLTLLLTATTGIIAIHTVEIWAYALVYLQLGAFRDFEQALYFSTVTYATIGYGDVVMPHGWRILGAIEGAVGVINAGLVDGIPGVPADPSQAAGSRLAHRGRRARGRLAGQGGRQ